MVAAYFSYTFMCIVLRDCKNCSGRRKGMGKVKEPRSGNNKPRLATNQSADRETPYTAKKFVRSNVLSVIH